MIPEEDYKFIARDKYLLRRIVTVLLRSYPGHGWQVEVQSRQGIFDVWNKLISQRYGYRKKLSEIEGGNHLEKVVFRIGGELLERARLFVGTADEAEIANREILISGELAGVDRG